ncbi:MAG: Nif3-like dinuclear metal center hexameric protein [Phycisphaerales bacterium]
MPTPTVADLVAAVERIAPPHLAESWDRVGLHVGQRAAAIAGPVLLTIDLTERVIDEAIRAKAAAIIAYHPPIWNPLTSITDATPRERILYRAIQAGIAVYSPHTALDAAPHGLTDWLCECLSPDASRIPGDCRALTPFAQPDPTRQVKIVTFVPAEKVENLRMALASAGAGIIGNYRVCSFATTGTGSFFGAEGSKPVVGKPGQVELVEEVRLEMVCSKRALPIAIETLREFHPYEEPAIDVYDLHGEPRRAVGLGRRLVLDQPAPVAELAGRLRDHLGVSRTQIALVDQADPPRSTIGVVAGSGGDALALAIAEQCDVFVTGEMSHHSIVEALHAGVNVILAGHTNTERGYLPRLAKRLASSLSSLEFRVSTSDADPLRRL